MDHRIEELVELRDALLDDEERFDLLLELEDELNRLRETAWIAHPTVRQEAGAPF